MPETTQDAPPPGAPPPPPEPGWNADGLTDFRGLRRSSDDRKIAGVAGGLARHLDLDPILVRVVLVVLIFFGGAGLLLYTALWLFAPDERTGRSVIGVSDATLNVLVFVVLALCALAVVGDLSNGVGTAWPPLVIAVIVVFAWLLGRDSRERRRLADSPVPPGTAGGPPAAYGAPAGPARAATRPRTRHDRGPLLFGPTLALVAVTLGLLGMLDAAGVPVADAAYPALALTVIGGMLVLGAFWGRPGGLVLVGLLASLVVAGASVGEPRFDGDRDVVVAPVSAAALGSSYAVPAGRIEVDLTGVDDLDALDGRTVALDANAGEIVVVVPDGLAVDFRGDIDYGGVVDTPFGSREGWDVRFEGRLGAAADPTVTVDAHLDFGHIELRQS